MSVIMAAIDGIRMAGVVRKQRRRVRAGR
jgi:hypothetical protein